MYSFISSKANEKIKIAKKLSEKKYRTQYGCFVIEGHKLVDELLRAGGDIRQIFVAEDVKDKYDDLLTKCDCNETYVVPRDLYLHISTEQSPQGIMAVCAIPEKDSVLADGNALILESVRDAGNLGTVIRTAVALGIKTLVLSEDCADLYNPKTLRAAMGAMFNANIVITTDTEAYIKQLVASGRRVFASVLADDAVEINGVDFKSSDCIVVGNEGNGISASVVKACSGSVIIPMMPCSESLNASVAAAILMWELTKGGKQ